MIPKHQRTQLQHVGDGKKKKKINQIISGRVEVLRRP